MRLFDFWEAIVGVPANNLLAIVGVPANNFLRSLFAFLLLLFSVGKAFSQKPQPDAVRLKSSEILTGKIMSIDEKSLRLRRADGSEKPIFLNEIDDVSGHSWRTRTVSGSLGAGGFRFFSDFLAEKRAQFGPVFQLKVGSYRSARRLRFWQFSAQPDPKFSVASVGWGQQFFISKSHFSRRNFWLGGLPEMHFVGHHAGAKFTLGAQAGGSILIAKKVRVFGEWQVRKPIFHIDRRPSASLVVGIRLNREFLRHYEKLNLQIADNQ